MSHDTLNNNHFVEKWVIRLVTSVLVCLAVALIVVGIVLYQLPEREMSSSVFQSQPVGQMP